VKHAETDAEKRHLERWRLRNKELIEHILEKQRELFAEDDDEADRFSNALPEAERRLMVTPSAYPDQVWQKLEAFEAILGDELMSGPRRDSVLLLALSSIKQDIVNLDLLEAIR